MIGYGIGKLFLNYTAVLNFELGTSRVVNSNENKSINFYSTS